MNSSLIGKIEKAGRYAEEPGRVTFKDFHVDFRGENDVHSVAFEDQHWHCTCDFFAEGGMCSHTIAMERLLKSMLPMQALSGAAFR